MHVSSNLWKADEGHHGMAMIKSFLWPEVLQHSHACLCDVICETVRVELKQMNE
jgi:hypothetical protein